MITIIEKVYKLIICHFLGDYFLQIDYIADTKKNNFYHLLVHCFLYTVPFAYIYQINYKIGLLLSTHIIVDLLKIKNKINYIFDQVLHFIIIFILYIIL